MYKDNTDSIFTTSIQWPVANGIQETPIESTSLIEDYEFEGIPETESHSTNKTTTINNLSEVTLEGKAIQLGKMLREKKQVQDMQKITLYLPKNLCSVLLLLKKQRIVASFSQIVKEALYQYLTD